MYSKSFLQLRVSVNDGEQWNAGVPVNWSKGGFEQEAFIDYAAVVFHSNWKSIKVPSLPFLYELHNFDYSELMFFI